MKPGTGPTIREQFRAMRAADFRADRDRFVERDEVISRQIAEAERRFGPGPFCSDAALFGHLVDELAALRSESAACFLDLDATESFALVGLIQLALKHPDVPDSVAGVGRAIIARIEHVIDRGPAVAEAIRRGFNECSPTPHSNGSDVKAGSVCFAGYTSA